MISAMQNPSYRNISFGSERPENRRGNAEKIKEKLNPDVTATDVGVGAAAAAAVPTATGVLKNANNGLKAATKITKQGGDVLEAIPKNKKMYKNLFVRWGQMAENSRILAPVAKIAKTPAFKGVAGVLGGGIALAFCIADMGNIVNTSADLAKSYNQTQNYNRARNRDYDRYR